MKHHQQSISPLSSPSIRLSHAILAIGLAGSACGIGNLALAQTQPAPASDPAREVIQINVKGNGDGLANALQVVFRERNMSPKELQKFYEKLIAEQPDNVTELTNFADFLKETLKDDERAEKLYQQALALDPNNAKRLHHFALFMGFNRKNYPRAEDLFEQAIGLAPKDASIVANLAEFMHLLRKNYPRAEKLFEQARAINPKHVETLNSFGFFTASVRKDYEAAEKLYMQAQLVDPKHVPSMVNLAQVKLIRGDHAGGKALLDQYFAAKPEPGAASLEAWFYRFIHLPTDYPKAKDELLALLKAGVRDQGWDFSGNIALAEKNRHPNLALIKAMEPVILDDAKLDTLTALLN